MITETMTIHEALSTLKVLDKRIAKETAQGNFCFAHKKCETKVNGLTVKEALEHSRSRFESVSALLRRRAAIRNALSQSNATRKVTIAGREYTMAEAIEMRKTGMELKQAFVDAMMDEYTLLNEKTRKWNEETLPGNADRYISSMYGSRDNIDIAATEAARKAYIESNTLEFNDPNDISGQCRLMQDEIDRFYAEVDSKISVSNALNTIEISY